MKATATRPARRIPADRLLAIRAAATAQVQARAQAEQARAQAEQAREDAAQQLRQPTAMWVSTPRLTLLPQDLYWSGEGAIPAVGETVLVERDGLSGPAKVAGYINADGFLGIDAEFEKVPAKLGKKPRATCVFGRQLKLAA